MYNTLYTRISVVVGKETPDFYVWINTGLKKKNITDYILKNINN